MYEKLKSDQFELTDVSPFPTTLREFHVDLFTIIN